MIVEFPQELVDYIIDHLHDDLQALCACSLVCSTWLPSSRFHKFRSMSISPIIEGLSTPNFDSCPVAAQAVRHLTTRLPASHPSRSLLTKYKLNNLSMCVNLESFHLTDIGFHLMPQDTIPSYFLFPKLKELKLVRCYFSNQTDFTRFMRAFPNLSSLSSRQTTYPFDIGSHLIFDVASYLPSGLRLRSLELDIRLPEFERQHGTGQFDTLNEILKQCGPTLESLAILNVFTPWNSRNWQPEANSIIDLSHNPNLRHLTLPPGWPTGALTRSMIPSVSTMTSSSLKHLSISFSRSFRVFDWERFDLLLSTPPFSNLQSLVLLQTTLGRPNRNGDTIPTEIATGMPRLMNRGTTDLRVKYETICV